MKYNGQKLYLYSLDHPRQKIFTAIMLIYCIILLFLLCPPSERIIGVVIAAAFVILVLGIRCILLVYLEKKYPFRLLIIDNENLTLINNNKTVQNILWSDIKTLSINYDGGICPELQRFPQFQINITANQKYIDFFSFVALSAFKLVKAATEKSIPIHYNTIDTQKYFEKNI